MRIFCIAVATIAIVLLALTLKPAPEATAAFDIGQAQTGVDPYTLHTTIEHKSLQQTVVNEPY